MAQPKSNLNLNKKKLEVYCAFYERWIAISKLQKKQNLNIKKDSYGYEVLTFICNCGKLHESIVR